MGAAEKLDALAWELPAEEWRDQNSGTYKRCRYKGLRNARQHGARSVLSSRVGGAGNRLARGRSKGRRTRSRARKRARRTPPAPRPSPALHLARATMDLGSPPADPRSISTCRWTLSLMPPPTEEWRVAPNEPQCLAARGSWNYSARTRERGGSVRCAEGGPPDRDKPWRTGFA
jgi:hypothetical protein